MRGSVRVSPACGVLTVWLGLCVAPAAAHPDLGSSTVTTQRLLLPANLPERFDVVVRLDGVRHTLHLERHLLRAPAFRSRAYLADGRTVEITPPAPATYRGWVVGGPRMPVVADLRPEGLNARVFSLSGGGPTWTIEGLPGEDRSSGETLHRVRSGCDPPATGFLDGQPGGCAAMAAPPGEKGVTAAESHAGQHLAEIAFDADYPFYQTNGSTVPSTVAAVEAILNQIDFFYARDVLITFTITNIIVRTAPFYPTGDPFSAFVAEWNANQTGVPRDLAHLLTRITGGGPAGAAFQGTACDLTEAYGYTAAGPGTTNYAGVAGHEVGHNFNAGHCHDFGCDSMCGGCLFFKPKTKDVIVAFRDSLTCLDETGAYSDPLPPYAHREVAHLTRDEVAAGAIRVFDVLANDHDGNFQSLSIDGFDSASEKGGAVTRSPGTGTGGADELVYTPPATVFPGDDHFTYTVGDGTGLQTTGDVELLVTAPGLMGYWKLDEGSGSTARDASGGGRDGFFSGPTWTAGVHGAALQFDGVDDYVSMAGFHRDTPSATITAWVKRDGSQSPFAALLLVSGANISLNFGQANELRYQWDHDPAASGWDSGLVVPDLQWVFVAVAVEPQRATIYLHDGVTLQSAVNPIAHALQDFTENILLGWDPIDPSRHFRGSLDDVRIYNYVLSASEIGALHDLGGKAHAPTPADGGRLLSGMRDMAWSPGLGAVSHDVYFGADYEAVRDATTASPEFRGNQASTSFLAPPPLLAGPPYFWRIDEVTAGGVVRGDVWVFAIGLPLARWKLDEVSGTVVDDSAGGFDGTYVGGPLLAQAPAQPELVGSVRLDGIDDSVQLPPLSLDSNEVTITAWFRRNGALNDADAILVTRSASTVAGLNLTTAGQLRFKWNDVGVVVNNEFFSTGMTIPDSQWVGIALVIAPDKTTVFLLRAGVLSSYTSYATNAREEFDGPLYLGRDPLNALRHIRGYFDDVRIYEHAMTRAEVDALFATGIGAGRVPDGADVPGTPLRLQALPNGDISLTWSSSCVATDVDYAVYEGEIGDFTSHLPVTCSTDGATSATVTPQPGNRYFLVVPMSTNREGSYGENGAGQHRPASAAACRTQFAEACN